MKLSIGPGALVAAAFIGPGTVTACTTAGAGFGFALLWALVFATVAAMILQGMAARLGVGGPVPLEVISLAVPAVIRRVQKLGGQAQLRLASPGQAHSGPFITDQGNFLMDGSFGEIADPKSMERDLNLIPGVVDNGLFTQIPATILVGLEKDGSVSIIE